MAMPFEQGGIEGGSFCLQWAEILFKVNIQEWSFVTRSIMNYYQCNNFLSQTYNIVSFEIDAFHTHYTPLSIDGHNNRSNVHYQILPIETMSLHTQHGPMSKNAHVHEDKLQYGITPMTEDRNNRVNVCRLKQLSRLQTKKYKKIMKTKIT